MYKPSLLPLRFLIFSLSQIACMDVVVTDLDYDLELIAVSDNINAGTMAGIEAGSEAGTLAGSEAGTLAGSEAGFLLTPTGDEVSISDLGIINSTGERNILACGSMTCDSNASCIMDSDQPYCECNARYEGDGESCRPQACPTNSNGTPNCICVDGYSGDLIYDLATRTWQGQCTLTNACELITLREDQFLSTTDVNFGDTIYQSCLTDEQSREHYRFSFSEGQVYAYYAAGGTNSSCTGHNDHKVDVDSWAYQGGVLSDNNLFHISNLNYTLDNCIYNVLAVNIGPIVERVYLAPTGRACTEGLMMPISCGEGACQVNGEMRCEQGEWVEYCTPEVPSNELDICDGLDTDCDGQSDEDFSIRESTCGVGACANVGQIKCEQGRIIDSCQVLEAEQNDASCDGIDQDCDGNTDENYMTQTIQCGVGVCQADGIILCQNGIEVTECTVGIHNGNDANCDGLDQDCDGQSDESYLGEVVSCGIGACRYEGSLRCSNGVVEELCTPNQPAEDDANCDGIDDDCDGRADEDYQGEVIFCGLGACSASGSTFCSNGEVFNDCTIGSSTGDDTDCDGIDNDCDGTPDESFISINIACSGANIYDCPVVVPTICNAGQTSFDCESHLAEINDNSCDGIDDDCDGQLDEDYISVEISCGQGVCADTSMTRCTNGEVTDRCLARSPMGDDSDCNGNDDDCDGSVDESFISSEVSCGFGACTSTGISRCENGVYSTTCTPLEVNEADESSCDGLDNDCDSRIDEAYVSIRTDCGNGVCYAVGSSSCLQGIETTNCVPLASTGDDADCDGIDQDCDANTDEDYPPVVDECGVGVCYNTADSSCIEGAIQNNCIEFQPTGNDADCDALDNDCDASTDEDYPPQIDQCGLGVCRTSAPSSCVVGQVVNNCVPLPQTGNDADCDGIDQDCDGTNDESYPPEVDSCGQGVCFNTALSSCDAGQRQNNCVELPQQGDDSICNGLDDDCDGRVDEGYVSVATSCTYGSVCVQPGMTACVNGNIQDVCDPPAFFTGSDNSCNNQDNDCDGQTDEGFVGGVYYCGNGVCQGSGFRSCVNGQEGGGNCSPNPNLASSDANCNGVDDDCDGRTDEHYGTQNTSCGTGVCARSGTRSCSNGNVISNCSAGNPTGDDSDTNGQDDDCDGQIDEDSCSFTSSNDGCDGTDNDCDGQVDEDFTGGNVSCGEGVCADTGTATCNNGNLSSTCSPNNQLSTVDNTCNNQDNDCDGRTDEHYQGVLTVCGTGACQRNGQIICSNGSTSDNCSPGAPSPNETRGNGIDDDCDGSVDEEPPPPNVCGNFEWYISTGKLQLSEFCCTTEPCESWAVSLSVMQPGDQASSAQDEIICKDNSPYAGRDLYYITSRGPYFYRGNGDFAYWKVAPDGYVRDSGRGFCRGPEGSGSGSF